MKGMKTMGLFKPAGNGQAKLKMGLFGDNASGKTHTASLTAIGLREMIKSKKPVYFFDTETGSDFVNKSIFKPAKVPLEVVKSRSFPDLLEATKEAEKNASIFMIDSITHVWKNFTEGYLKKSNQKFIQLWDWSVLKKEWAAFTELFINSDLHIILMGRQSSIFETSEEVRGGKTVKVSEKIGAKMNAESDMGYEPSLLVQMERDFVGDEANGMFVRKANIVKDRFNIIDGKVFTNPTFKDFLPHVELLDLEGTQIGIDTSRNSESVFNDMGEGQRDIRLREREIAVDLVKSCLSHFFPSTKEEDKKVKMDLLLQMFGTRSWVQVEKDWSVVRLERLIEVTKSENGIPSLLEQECIKITENLMNPPPPAAAAETEKKKK